mmetsp:Transcript_18252/g.50789  ORF Transcript_18252/g.50789 Transcript_18252/m.50789 type:complete len:87 (+) Transcript_18252:703-963(+)
MQQRPAVGVCGALIFPVVSKSISPNTSIPNHPASALSSSSSSATVSDRHQSDPTDLMQLARQAKHARMLRAGCVRLLILQELSVEI